MQEKTFLNPRYVKVLILTDFLFLNLYVLVCVLGQHQCSLTSKLFALLIGALLLLNGMIVYAVKFIRELTLKKTELLESLHVLQKDLGEIRSIQHEYKNHLHTINSMLQLKESEHALAYMNKLRKRKIAQIPDIECPIVLAVLAGFRSLAEKEGVHFAVLSEANATPLPLSSEKTTELLANLIRNAFEAVGRREPGGFVSVSLTKDDREHGIIIRNTGVGDLQAFGHDSARKPKWKKRGHGLRNVHSILQKCGGKLLVSIDADETEVTVKIPNEVANI